MLITLHSLRIFLVLSLLLIDIHKMKLYLGMYLHIYFTNLSINQTMHSHRACTSGSIHHNFFYASSNYYPSNPNLYLFQSYPNCSLLTTTKALINAPTLASGGNTHVPRNSRTLPRTIAMLQQYMCSTSYIVSSKNASINITF